VSRDTFAHQTETRRMRQIRRAFDDLKVRPKLILLHNLFFLVLTVSVYFSVIPVFEQKIASARERELAMVTQIFRAELPMTAGRGEPDSLDLYNYREGLARDLDLSPEGQAYLRQFPKRTWQQGKDTMFRMGRDPGEFRRVSLSPTFYEEAVQRARTVLFLVLGTIYVLSILALEFLIMPQYVYQPLHLMLNADAATLRGDRENELIDGRLILHDEIGQIMRSRNETVAQLRRQEDHLASALRQLEEQDRLVSLGLLSTSVAHELNTPLAVLQGSIEKLIETTEDRATLDRLNRMLRVTQRLRKISESLLDFARKRKKDEMEPVELRPLIDESWSLVAIDEKASEVHFENLTKSADIVTGNADRLIQVFVNLLRNALLAAPPGGQISVESKTLHRAGQSWVSCIVKDNGIGIPAHILPNLFEAFVSTRLDAKGTGLGLTVAEGIISQHGGTISASNGAEGGAVLEVLLPGAAETHSPETHSMVTELDDRPAPGGPAAHA
jgi:Signal transduction histidine kinase regulating C4-dicarboxylate transport system